MTTEIPAGSDVRLGPPTLPPHPPFLAALRHALGTSTAVVFAAVVEDEDAPTNVVGLLPQVVPDEDEADPAQVAEALETFVSAEAGVSVARLPLGTAVAALRVAPPIGGSDVETLLVDAARSPRGTAQMWSRLGARRVWVPVDGTDGLDTQDALGGAVQVAELPGGHPVPDLPLHERGDTDAVHVFSGPWQLIHADAPHPAAIRTTLDRVAAAMPVDAALAIDVGCLHATLLRPGR